MDRVSDLNDAGGQVRVKLALSAVLLIIRSSGVGEVDVARLLRLWRLL